MALKLEIVTPEGVVWKNDDVLAVTLPTSEGEIEILAGHVPLLTIIKAGYLKVSLKNGSSEDLAIDEGYARCSSDTVSILAQQAIKIDDIDASTLQQAKAAAEIALENAKKQDSIDDAEVERLEAIVRFAVAQQLAKSKRNK